MQKALFPSEGAKGWGTGPVSQTYQPEISDIHLMPSTPHPILSHLALNPLDQEAAAVPTIHTVSM